MNELPLSQVVEDRRWEVLCLPCDHLKTNSTNDTP